MEYRLSTICYRSDLALSVYLEHEFLFERFGASRYELRSLMRNTQVVVSPPPPPPHISLDPKALLKVRSSGTTLKRSPTTA
ncbi:jg18141 [Pararge aegeria aegeria]|uniref:Jg18141 protein n=1 Tax=Pararge aegeria aegeria TaxID=348720 RepID=A0A8S4R2Z6_9NEOP|nr:jg18141 [Pararge aegeria aegeria]